MIILEVLDDHGTISLMDIEKSEQKMKQEWSLLDPMVDLSEQIEEEVEFTESANTPIPGGKVVNIAYLLILRTEGMEKACEKWEYMQVGLKTCMLSKTISHKPTGATRSARKQHQRPMDMGRQQIVHRIQKPRSTQRMLYKHSHVQHWKTRRQCQTSPARTSHYLRA